MILITSFRRHWAERKRRRFWRLTASSALCQARTPIPRQHRRSAQHQDRLSDRKRRTAYIPLSELASITLDTGASYIFRERNQRFVPIKFSVRGRDLAGAVAEAQERISRAVKLPTGYRIVFAGEFEWLQQAKKRLLTILPVTLCSYPCAALWAVQFLAR